MAENSEFTGAGSGAKGGCCPGEPEFVFGTGKSLYEALRAARVVCFAWDVASDVVVRSANADEVLGFPATRDTGSAFFKGVHWEDRAVFSATIRSLSPEKPEFTASYRYVSPRDGQELFLEDRGRAEFDRLGRMVRLSGVARDVTEQRRREGREERLRTLLDHTPSLVFMKDEAGRYVYLNEAYEQRFVHSEDWRGKTDFDFWPKESAELFRKDDAEVLRGGQAKQFLEDSRDRTGKRYCWLCYKFPFTDSDGKRYVGGVGIDATAQVEAEGALRASEEMNRQTLQALPAHIAVLDGSGRIVAINRAWEEFAVRNEAGGKPSVSVGAGYIAVCRRAAAEGNEFAAQALRGIEAVMTGRQEQFTMEYPCHSPREQRWFYMTVVPLGPASEGGAVVTHLNITERKRAEQELQEQQRFLHSILHTLPDIVYVFDVQERRVLYASRGDPKANVALTASEMQGLGAALLPTVLHPEDLSQAEALLARWETAKDHDVLESEIRVRGEGGDWAWRSTRETVFARDPDGRVRQVLGASQDITERKRAEAAVRESEELFRVMFTQSSVAKAQADLATGRFLRVNEALCRMLGCSESELLGMRFSEITHPEEREKDWARFQKLLRGEVGSYQCEKRYVRKDGSVMWAEVAVGLIRDAGGKPLRSAAVIQDITARKQTEQALRESEERFRVAQEMSPDGFSILRPVRDARGRVADFTWLYVNAAAERFIGKTVEELQGRRLLKLFPGHRGTEFWKAYRRVAETRQRIVFEAQYGAETGAPRWFRVAVLPVGGDIAVLAQDVTRQKAFEMELRRLVDERTAELEGYRKHLEEMVKQRTAELNRAMEDLKRSNRELEHFAYAASHDLQEPLRAVGGYVQLLQRCLPEHLDDRARHYIAGAAEGASRMSQQILDLLELSRVGTQGMRLSRVNLGEPLQAALQNLAFSIRAAHARVTCRALPVLDVDEGQITQLFQNLIGNSLKFRGEHRPEIHVGARREASRWVIRVRDNGIGIEAQHFERIFVVFQRLHTRIKYPGTGVGLTICRRIVERHGGQIWVESQPGHGATFCFALPINSNGAESKTAVARPNQRPQRKITRHPVPHQPEARKRINKPQAGRRG